MKKAVQITAGVWKQSAIVERFLNFHAAIPLAREQIGVMLSLLASSTEPVKSFLDLGCGDGILNGTLLGQWDPIRQAKGLL